ncbi:unnamed protein product, partial [Meganyctiphanes norvegica]
MGLENFKKFNLYPSFKPIISEEGHFPIVAKMASENLILTDVKLQLKLKISTDNDKKITETVFLCISEQNVEVSLKITDLDSSTCLSLNCKSADQVVLERAHANQKQRYFIRINVAGDALNIGLIIINFQVGHASLGLYRILLEDKEKYQASLEEWEEFGEKKITLKGKNSHELLELQKKAIANDLPTYMVQDAGRTQIPSGSTTVLAIFGDEEAVNEVTGKLRLL